MGKERLVKLAEALADCGLEIVGLESADIGKRWTVVVRETPPEQPAE
jgi:hypothetical protein